MDFGDKLRNKFDQASGKTKETAGKVTDNERLEAEGRVQHDKAEVAEDIDDVKEKTKDTAEDVKESFRR